MTSTNEVSLIHPETLAAPSGATLSQMAIGHYVSRALFLAAKLGLADLLKDGPRKAVELAAASGTHAASLERVMRLLASVGVFAEQAGNVFALTALGEPLRSDHPESLRDLVMLFAGPGVQDSWKEIEYCVRTGNPVFRSAAPDADIYDLAAQDPAATESFDRAMATFASQTAAAVASAIDFSSFEKVVDVGGGSGSFLIGILKANPGLSGMIFDQPHTAERAGRQIAAAGLADRCQVVGGSFFKYVPGGADACILKDVLIDWDDEQAISILKNCRAALPSHGQIMIVEEVYPARIDQSPESRRAAATDVLMLVCTGGRQRTETEFRNLLAESGFRLTGIVPTAARACVIQAEQV